MPSSQTSGPAIIARFSNDIDLDVLDFLILP